MRSARLNILQTCFSPSWGGLEMQALEVTKQLGDRGHPVWLACLPGSRLHEEAVRDRVRTVPLAVRGYIHPLLTRKLARFLREESVDVIHSHLSRDLPTLVIAGILSRQQVPIILSKRVGSYISKKDLLHRFTYAHVQRVLAISEVIRKNVLETTPISPDRVLTIHDAIDTELFSPDRVERMHVRHELGLTADTMVVGLVGRFSPGKGHEEFLHAAAILRRKYRNIHFLIVGEASHGEGNYAQKIRTLCRMLELESTVSFTGFRKDIPEVMAAFDILAFPSHAESFGVVLIEAMAMERPVVSTNCDGVLDIVVDGKTGIYVRPREAEELAYALGRLIENPELRRRMGVAGRERVLELFDRGKQLARFEEVYFELAGLSEPGRRASTSRPLS